MRYRYYTNNKNIVICESSFAGKKVRGMAKCSPADEFEINYGMLLAKARVDYKIAEMRVKKSRIRMEAAIDAHDKTEVECVRAGNYCSDSFKEFKTAEETLNSIMKMSE